jgi:hypothetical protein
MIFKPYNLDFGIKYNGVTYTFDHVDSFVVEDPQQVKLIRGANAQNKVGLVFVEGAKDPKKVTVTIKGITSDMHTLMMEIYQAKARCEIFAIDRTDGSSKIGKNAVLSQEPQQLTIDESPESMDVLAIFETFDLVETHKS